LLLGVTNSDRGEKVGVERLENINKSLSLKLGGDQGTQDISRVLRLPGTYNFKLENNPREVTVVKDDGPAYCLDDFNDFTIPEEDSPKQSEVKDLEEATSSPERPIPTLLLILTPLPSRRR